MEDVVAFARLQLEILEREGLRPQQLAYIGDKKQGKFDLVYGDGSRAVGESATAAPEPSAAPEPVAEVASAEPAPEPEPEPQPSASATSGSGSDWIVNASLQGEIEDYLANAKKKGKQLRALAIRKDGSGMGVGLYTPKSESGWASGGGAVLLGLARRPGAGLRSAAQHALRLPGGRQRRIGRGRGQPGVCGRGSRQQADRRAGTQPVRRGEGRDRAGQKVLARKSQSEA